MADVEQTDAAGSSQGQDVASTSNGPSEAVASTSSGSTGPVANTSSESTGVIAGTSNGAAGVVASANKPVGIVAPQKRVAVVNNAATGTNHTNGAALFAGTPIYADIPPILAQAQANIINQEPPNRVEPQVSGPNAVSVVAQPGQPSNTVLLSGNRLVTISDLEKGKRIQQQLLLILHSRECQRRENRGNDEQPQPCSVPHCLTIKNVLNHMLTCNAVRTCTVPHCRSSRQIIGHWQHCVRDDCFVCYPLKQAQRSFNANADNIGELWYTVYRRLFGNVPITVSQATAVVGRAATVNPQRQQNEVEGSAEINRVSSIVRLPVPQSTTRMHVVLPNTATPMQRNKAWHQSVTSELRNHIVLKLVKSVYPTAEPQAALDRRILNLVAMCKRVEQNLYEQANSRAEYHRLVAEKMYKFQKELEEKRKQRQQMQGQQSTRAVQARVSPIVHLKRSKPLFKSARTMPKPIGTVRPTLRMFIRVHSNGMRVLQNRTGARQSSHGQNVAAVAPATTRPVNNDAVVPVQAVQTETPPSSVEPRPNSSENERPAGTSTSNTPPVQPVTPAPQENSRDGDFSEEREFSIQRCIDSLLHACQCREASCQLSSCQRMKRVVQHIKTCRMRTSGGCPICKQLVALCCHHARHCELNDCSVPFCFNIKQKLKHERRHDRTQQAQILRRRMEPDPATVSSQARLFRPKSATVRSGSLRLTRTRSQERE